MRGGVVEGSAVGRLFRMRPLQARRMRRGPRKAATSRGVAADTAGAPLRPPHAATTQVGSPQEASASAGAARLVAACHAARQFTDTASFLLRCGVCQVRTLPRVRGGGSGSAACATHVLQRPAAPDPVWRGAALPAAPSVRHMQQLGPPRCARAQPTQTHSAPTRHSSLFYSPCTPSYKIGIKGEKEAAEHAKATGHNRFAEY